MADRDSKTEEATPKRLSDARKKGQIAKSQDLVAAASFFTFTILMGLLGQYIYINGRGFMERSLSFDLSMIEMSPNNAGSLLMDSLVQYGLMVLPFLLIALLVGLVANLFQTGFLHTTEPLKPDLNRINPIQGFKNIFSIKSLFNLAKNLIKLILVFYITYKNLMGSAIKIVASGNVGTEKLFFFILDFTKDLAMDVAVLMVVLGITDYIVQKWEYKRNMKMSIQEIKDEYKEMEGDPQIKSQRQQRQRQLAMSRMMADLPSSTVVVTNPTHIAVALRYEAGEDEAPVVVAKGADYIAEKIKEAAKEHNIPILENKPLARTLYKEVEIGEYIPEKLYKAVAEVLALVYEINERKKYKI